MGHDNPHRHDVALKMLGLLLDHPDRAWQDTSTEAGKDMVAARCWEMADTFMAFSEPDIPRQEITGTPAPVKVNWVDSDGVQVGETQTLDADAFDAVMASPEPPSTVGEYSPIYQASVLHREALAQGFGSKNLRDAVHKVESELEELRQALDHGNHEDVTHELGDLLFSTILLSVSDNISPSVALRDANKRFQSRFLTMKGLAADRGVTLGNLSDAEQTNFWNEAKAISG